MKWIPVQERLPKENMSVLITAKEKANNKIRVISCDWGPVVDMETGEIIGNPSFVNYVSIDNTDICINYNDNKTFKTLAWMPFPPPFEDGFRVIVAGSRTLEDYQLVKDNLLKIFSKHWPTSIVCGEARGADTLGRKFAEEFHIKVDSFPADWNAFGKQAGYIRNEQMADNADALIAFWNGTSAGTKHMINTAKKRNLQTRVIKI